MGKIALWIVSFIGIGLILDWAMLNTVQDAVPGPSSIGTAWTSPWVLVTGICFLILGLLIAWAIGQQHESTHPSNNPVRRVARHLKLVK